MNKRVLSILLLTVLSISNGLRASVALDRIRTASTGKPAFKAYKTHVTKLRKTGNYLASSNIFEGVYIYLGVLQKDWQAKIKSGKKLFKDKDYFNNTVNPQLTELRSLLEDGLKQMKNAKPTTDKELEAFVDRTGDLSGRELKAYLQDRAKAKAYILKNMAFLGSVVSSFKEMLEEVGDVEVGAEPLEKEYKEDADQVAGLDYLGIIDSVRKASNVGKLGIVIHEIGANMAITMAELALAELFFGYLKGWRAQATFINKLTVKNSLGRPIAAFNFDAKKRSWILLKKMFTMGMTALKVSMEEDL